jgi:dihydroceramidase
MPGYWEPHTASVDFCEPNYAVSPYVAEFHNVWSSLILTGFGVFGMLYSNPTNEWCIRAMYLTLAIVGLGSVGLHGTLHWLLQSSDEVPMLWQILSFIHVLWICRQRDAKVDKWSIGLSFFGLAFVQTFLYYTFQQIYAVFIASMIFYVTLLIFWTHGFIDAKANPEFKRDQTKLHIWSTVYFVVYGVVLWVIDMNLCDTLMPYYIKLSGFTLHVFWHIFAGLGSYYLCVLLTGLRVNQQKLNPEIKWYALILPYIALVDKTKK